MIALPPRPQGHPIWRSPLFEWGVIAIVVAAVVGVVWREAREVQMLAERAAVQSTLGALRTAFIADHLRWELRKQASGSQTSPLELNPFLLLDRPQPNYAGELSMGAVAQAPAGAWVSDLSCPCIGYRPLYPDKLLPQADPAVLWFGISKEPGARQLKPAAPYRWAGDSIH